MRTPRSTQSCFHAIFLLFPAACFLSSIACGPPQQYQTLSLLEATPLLANSLQGNHAPVHDPSIFLEDGTYYLFTSDSEKPSPRQYLPIRCSTDKLTWTPCGQVLTALPAWLTKTIPGLSGLWAPDISFFGGLYHLYYAASTPGSQLSLIALQTNTTLDSRDPAYRWVDQGPVLASHPGDDFNAIDPSILVDDNRQPQSGQPVQQAPRIWITYGSYWTGIKQREIDLSSGMLLASSLERFQLAARPATSDDAIEGSSLVHHGSFYFLFLSVDHCCETSPSQDDYKQIVGRSASPNGPFLDARGVALLQGGGSILLEGNPTWMAPGGGTAYLNPSTGESLLVFHALDMAHHATPTLWIKEIAWPDDWPFMN